MLTLLRALAATAWLLITIVTPAQAVDGTPAKLALVIGNHQYKGGHALANAANDARLMSNTLAMLGFAVTERYNLTREQFASTVTAFSKSIPPGGVAMVYYAGHGMQVEGNNYLNPVDMRLLGSQDKLQEVAYPLSFLVERLEKSAATVRIVVLDACRNNPFRRGGGTKYRSIADLGLSSMEVPRGTVLAYSTSPGQVAEDGTGRNSVYTEALAKALREPGAEIEQVLKKVAFVVGKKTSGDQLPWYESGLVGRYFFNADRAPAHAMVNPQGPVSGGGQGRSDSSGRLRSTVQDDVPWYRDLTAAEWNRLDWEIQQRVKRLTADEIPALRHKAGGGSVVAQTVLGLAYRDGLEKAVEPATGRVGRFRANNTEAWHWLKKAAHAGFAVAQTEVGEMYYAGHGVDRNVKESRIWLERAAEAQYPRAKVDLLQLGLESNRGDVEYRDAMNAILESMKMPPAQVIPPR